MSLGYDGSEILFTELLEYVILYFLVCLSCHVCCSTNPATVGQAAQPIMAVKQRYNDLLKSEGDKRLYRGLILENGMKVLLVSDDTTDKSAACIDIAVGKL